MVQLHVGVLLAHLDHDVFPELEGFQYVRFVHTGYAFAAFARCLKCHMGNALNLGARIAHGVKGFFRAGEVSVGGGASPTGLAEIDVTGEFANDENV